MFERVKPVTLRMKPDYLELVEKDTINRLKLLQTNPSYTSGIPCDFAYFSTFHSYKSLCEELCNRCFQIVIYINFEELDGN